MRAQAMLKNQVKPIEKKEGEKTGSNLYAVVRVRGSVKSNPKVEYTLGLLKLRRVNHCILLPKRPETEGILKVAENFIAWGEINKKTLDHLIKKRGKETKDKNIIFRLTPPSKGHKPIKSLYPKGACGYRGEKINELLERMI